MNSLRFSRSIAQVIEEVIIIYICELGICAPNSGSGGGKMVGYYFRYFTMVLYHIANQANFRIAFIIFISQKQTKSSKVLFGFIF